MYRIRKRFYWTAGSAACLLLLCAALGQYWFLHRHILADGRGILLVNFLFTLAGVGLLLAVVGYAFHRIVSRPLEHQNAELLAIQQELVLAHAYLESLFRTLPDGLLVVEADHTIVDCNPAARVLLGVPREEAIGRKCHELCLGRLDAQEDLRATCPVLKALESGRPAQVTHVLRVGGGERHVEVTAAALPGAGGPPRVLEVLRDVTEELRAGELVRQKSLELEGLIHALGHDLKAPLANIRGFADLLLEGSLTPEQTAHFMTRVRYNAEVMVRLITDLLDLSRIGLQDELLEEVDAGAAASEALRLLEPRIAERGATVVVAAGMPVVRYPKSRLLEVFTNLVGNALEHTRETAGLRVEIGWERAGAEHVFRVRDNGPGVDPAEQVRIFEPFYSRTKKKTGSSGLGLTIVKRIVEKNGGRIRVESGPGAGAAFVFTVPA